MSMKNSDANGNRNRLLPACNAVPQSTASLRALHLLQITDMNWLELAHGTSKPVFVKAEKYSYYKWNQTT